MSQEDHVNHGIAGRYSAFVTLWKAFVAFLTAVTGGEVAIFALPLPDDLESFRLRLPIYVTGMIFAVWRAWENIRKQFALFRYPWEQR